MKTISRNLREIDSFLCQELWYISFSSQRFIHAVHHCVGTIDISQILNQRNQNVNQVNDPWINSWITNQKPAFPKWTHVIGMIGFVGHLVSGKLSRELIVRFREGSGCFRINKCRICCQFTWYLCFQVYSYNYCHSKYIAVKFTCHFCMFSGFG